ncbi:MAG: hypothetical protein QM722_10870 [Piscinibacter sp.]
MPRPLCEVHPGAGAKAGCATSMAISYHIQEADLSVSAGAIRELWVANLVGHDERSAGAKLRLGYAENPAGLGSALLLYPEGDAEPKGVQGLHPRAFCFGTRRLRAVGLADYAVDAAHRSLGPALMLMRQGTQLGRERFDLVYGLPNQKAAAVLARAGLKRLGFVQRYAKPLRTRAQLGRRLPAALAGAAAPFVDAALRLRDEFRAVAQRPALRCRTVAWSEAEVDSLWAQRPQALLLSERSLAMLRWRFGGAERGEWRLSLAHDRAGALRGYVVWRMKTGFAEIGDFFSADPAALTAPLMLAFTREARRAGATSISVSFFGAAAVARELQRSGMKARPQQAPLFKLPGDDAALDEPERWYVTSFDNDAD